MTGASDPAGKTGGGSLAISIAFRAATSVRTVATITEKVLKPAIEKYM